MGLRIVSASATSHTFADELINFAFGNAHPRVSQITPEVPKLWALIEAARRDADSLLAGRPTENFSLKNVEDRSLETSERLVFISATYLPGKEDLSLMFLRNEGSEIKLSEITFGQFSSEIKIELCSDNQAHVDMNTGSEGETSFWYIFYLGKDRVERHPGHRYWTAGMVTWAMETKGVAENKRMPKKIKCKSDGTILSVAIER